MGMRYGDSSFSLGVIIPLISLLALMTFVSRWIAQSTLGVCLLACFGHNDRAVSWSIPGDQLKKATSKDGGYPMTFRVIGTFLNGDLGTKMHPSGVYAVIGVEGEGDDMWVANIVIFWRRVFFASFDGLSEWAVLIQPGRLGRTTLEAASWKGKAPQDIRTSASL
jgi:hypothetical protein